MVVGGVAAVLFVRRQLRIEIPFLELRTFKSRNYSVSVLSSIFLYFIMMGSSIIMPLYIQQTLERSAQTYGENAFIHGVNMTFLAMTLTSVILLAFSVFGTKEKKNGKAHGKQE